MVASNVQSLMAVKWDVAKAMLIRLQADVLILSEIWFKKDVVNLGVPGYHTIRGSATHRGKMIVMWIRRVPGERHKKVRDGRHSLVVLSHGRHGQHLVGGVHMPQRNESTQYVEEARALRTVVELYKGMPVLILGDWNRFLPRHEVTRALAQSMRTNILTTGDEGLLHKDWALAPSSLVDECHVAYAPRGRKPPVGDSDGGLKGRSG